jgi:hypothetical protein
VSLRFHAKAANGMAKDFAKAAEIQLEEFSIWQPFPPL